MHAVLADLFLEFQACPTLWFLENSMACIFARDETADFA
jgi:hypothetical protein